MPYIRPYSTTHFDFGYNQTIIIDFHGQESMFYNDNVTKLVLKRFPDKTVQKMVEENKEDKKEILEFISNLIETDLFFYTNEPDYFPVSLDYEKSASIVDNIHICFNNNSNDEIKFIENIIISFGIITARLDFSNCSDKFIYRTIEKLSKAALSSIECVVNFSQFKREVCNRMREINPSVLVVSVKETLSRKVCKLFLRG